MTEKKSRSIFDYIFCATVGSVFIYAVNSSIITSTIVEVTDARLYFTGLIFLLIFMAVFYNRFTMLITGAAVVLTAFFIWTTWDNRSEQSEFITEMILIIRGLSAYRSEFGPAAVNAISGAVAFFTAVFMYRRFNFYVLTLGGSFMFALCWVMDYRREDFAFVLFLLCFCLLMIKQFNFNSLSALTALPVCIAALVISSFLPGMSANSDNPMRVLLNKPLTEIGEFFYLAFNPKYFSFQTTGFTRADGELGGPVTLNDRKVMRVMAPNRLYLSGATKDFYTGRGWESSTANDAPSDSYNPARLEFLETAAALLKIDADRGYSDYYLPVDTITVDVINRTGSLFRPAKSWEPVIFPGSGDVDIYRAASGDWQTEELMSSGTSYGFDYLSPNTDLDFIEDALNETYRGYYKDNPPLDTGRIYEIFERYLSGEITDEYAARLFNRFSGRFTRDGRISDALEEYAEGIYGRYMNLPENLPPRVYELAEELTAESETDYQKVKAIEEYLLSFPYTLSPGEVPAGADFVDYFLFEGREGYCTYYASAMAVLARCVGVPSRYAEGYVLPAQRDGDGYFTVTNETAHSWAEVYLEGYGWLTLEATAPYHSTMANPGTSASVPTDMFAYDFRNDPDYLRYLMNMGFDSSSAVLSAPAEQTRENFFTDEFFAELRNYFVIFILSVIAAVFIFIRIQALREKLRYRSVNKMPVNEQAQIYFKGLLKMTSYYHYPVTDGETSQMYCQRLGDRFLYISDTINMPDLNKIYYKARYGEKALSEDELNVLKECHGDFKNFLAEILWRPAFMYLRFVRRVTVI